MQSRHFRVPALKSGPFPEALEAELAQEIRDVAILGIRSKTRIPKAVLESAPLLLVIGAYCIGVELFPK